MTTFPLSALADPIKLEELFQKIENRKKLEEMLMDPRVIELSRQSPQSRQALAAIVRRLQEERVRKRRIRNAEQNDELQPVKWFNCINFLKSFSAPPRQSTRQALRHPETPVRQRNKFTVSTPNLESTALPDLPPDESPILCMKDQPKTNTTMAEVALCIPNLSKDSSLPLNLMEFCASEKGRNMITSLINATDLKKLFGLKPNLPTESHQLLQCNDYLNFSDLRCTQYYVPRKSSCQRLIILKSRASRNYPALSVYNLGLKNVVSSSTQTAYSGSCSRCSTNCRSIDSFSSYTEAAPKQNFKQNPFNVALCKRNMLKSSKSQSAIYTTDSSECDCDDFSSPDELCGGKYLSRILTHAAVPKVNYLATPDVLVTYSGKGHSSDSSSSGSSCTACKGNISSESLQREPREIWTQKRLKTSCESCLNTFRTEYIRKPRYPKEITNSINRRASFGSLCSEDSSQGIPDEIKEVGEEFYLQAKSILDNVGQTNEIGDFDRRKELIAKEVSVVEDRIRQEENYDVDIKNNNCLNSDGNNVASIKLEGEQADLKKKETEFVYECAAPMIEKSLSYSSLDKGPNGNISDSPETQRDGSPSTKENMEDIQSVLARSDLLLPNESICSTGDESTNSESNNIPRNKVPRKRVRNKCDSDSFLSDSSSTSPLPKPRNFARRMKPKFTPIQKPISPLQNVPKTSNKQKSRKKNCAIM